MDRRESLGEMNPLLWGFEGDTALQRGLFSTQIWVALGSWWFHFPPCYPRLQLSIPWDKPLICL